MRCGSARKTSHTRLRSTELTKNSVPISPGEARYHAIGATRLWPFAQRAHDKILRHLACPGSHDHMAPHLRAPVHREAVLAKLLTWPDPPATPHDFRCRMSAAQHESIEQNVGGNGEYQVREPALE